MPSLGMPELLVILVIVIVLFGFRRLPEIGQGLGEGIRNFKRSMKTANESDRLEEKHDPQSPQ